MGSRRVAAPAKNEPFTISSIKAVPVREQRSGMKPPKTIYIEIENGCLTGVYGDKLSTKEQIIFVLRDKDNINGGDEDPAPRKYEPEVVYW